MRLPREETLVIKGRNHDKWFKCSDEVMSQFKAVLCNGSWVIELSPGKYLHWIETTNDTPTTVSRADMTMIRYDFKAQADGIIEWLKKRWKINGPYQNNQPFKVEVDIDEERKLKTANNGDNKG